jgi:hypothetical protein
VFSCIVRVLVVKYLAMFTVKLPEFIWDLCRYGSNPELVFIDLILLIFFIGFTKLQFTVAGLYWIYP